MYKNSNEKEYIPQNTKKREKKTIKKSYWLLFDKCVFKHGVFQSF